MRTRRLAAYSRKIRSRHNQQQSTIQFHLPLSYSRGSYTYLLAFFVSTPNRILDFNHNCNLLHYLRETYRLIRFSPTKKEGVFLHCFIITFKFVLSFFICLIEWLNEAERGRAGEGTEAAVHDNTCESTLYGYLFIRAPSFTATTTNKWKWTKRKKENEEKGETTPSD